MKWQHVSLSCLLPFVVAVNEPHSLKEAAISTMPSGEQGLRIQMGFYDLLSQQKEIYDVTLKQNEGTFLSQITAQDNPDFLLKGRWLLKSKKKNEEDFDYQPVYASHPDDIRMLSGKLDYYQHNDARLYITEMNGTYVLLDQTGMIFVRQPVNI